MILALKIAKSWNSEKKTTYWKNLIQWENKIKQHWIPVTFPFQQLEDKQLVDSSNSKSCVSISFP